MPRLPPPKHSQFKPGVSGNPDGARRHNQDIIRIKRLTNAEVAEVGSMIVMGNIQALEDIIIDSDIEPNCKHSVLKVWMAKIALNSLKRGDGHALDTFLNRVTGKVREKIELTGNDGGPIRNDITAMTSEERLAELKRLRKKRLRVGRD